MLEGARAVLADAPIDEPQARAVADWLRAPERRAVPGPPRDARRRFWSTSRPRWRALPDWQTFTRGAQHTRNRIGLLACTSPADALIVLKADERGVPVSRDTDTPEGRQVFLRSPIARELIEFMLSPDYEAAFAPDPEEPS